MTNSFQIISPSEGQYSCNLFVNNDGFAQHGLYPMSSCYNLISSFTGIISYYTNLISFCCSMTSSYFNLVSFRYSIISSCSNIMSSCYDMISYYSNITSSGPNMISYYSDITSSCPDMSYHRSGSIAGYSSSREFLTTEVKFAVYTM